MKALEATHPRTVNDFYRLIFRKVRHVLLDMVRRQGRDQARRHDDLPKEDSSGRVSPYDRADTIFRWNTPNGAAWAA